MATESFDLKTLSLYIPNKATLYRIMIKKGYVLPSETSKACTEEYLLDCLHDKIFSIKAENFRPFLLEKDVSISSLRIIEEIKKKASKPLGFTLDKLPDKKWLLDVLYSLDKQNKIFSDPTEEITRELPEG